MKLGENIYRLRTAKKLSQGDLAEQLEVSRQSVSKWENNVSVPDLDKLIRMSELFAVSLDTLVNGTIPEVPEETEQPAQETTVPMDEASAETEPPADKVQDSAESDIPERTVTVSSGTEETAGDNAKVYPPVWPALPSYEPGPTAGEHTEAKRFAPWKRVAAVAAAVVMLCTACAMDYARLFSGGLFHGETATNVSATPAPSAAVPETEAELQEEDIIYIPVDPQMAPNGIYSIQEADGYRVQPSTVIGAVIFVPEADTVEEVDPNDAESWVSSDQGCAEETPPPEPAE